MLSDQYSIPNGVKQGGCLSPTLFSIYLNDLIDYYYVLLIFVVEVVIMIWMCNFIWKEMLNYVMNMHYNIK